MIIVIVITVEMLLLIFSVNHEKDIAIPILADLSVTKAFHVLGYSVIPCFKTFRHSTDPPFHRSGIPPIRHSTVLPFLHSIISRNGSCHLVALKAS